MGTKPKMKKILLINENCSDNIGDHAINYGAIELAKVAGYETVSFGFDAEVKYEKPKIINKETRLTKFNKKIRSYLISNNQPLKYFVWYLRNVNRLKKITRDNYSYAIIGGGQLIQRGGTFPIAMYFWSRYCKKQGIPVYILGVGCAEDFNIIDKYFYKKSFSCVNEIYVRDNSSIEKLDRFFNTNAKYIPDLAYALYADFPETKSNVTIIGVTAYYVYLKNIRELGLSSEIDIDEYVNRWLDKVVVEIQAGNSILFASTTVQDSVISKLVYNKSIDMFGMDKVKILESVPSTFEYINILRTAKKVFSGRMHSLILGHISGCEIEAFNINAKIDLYMNEYSKQKPRDINQNLIKIFTNIFTR